MAIAAAAATPGWSPAYTSSNSTAGWPAMTARPRTAYVAGPRSRSCSETMPTMRRVGEQGRQQRVIGHGEREAPVRRALTFQRHRHANRAREHAERAGDGGRSVLLHRADDVANRGEFHRRVEARQHGVHVRARHREAGRPDVVERVAEGQDARAVHVGDGAGGAELEVARDEADADGIAGAERFGGCRRLLRAAAWPWRREHEAAAAE